MSSTQPFYSDVILDVDIILTANQARDRIARLCDADVVPVLTETDMQDILRATQIGTVWAASTVYLAGSVVVPATRNRRLFQAEFGGTSAATEPAWPSWGNGSPWGGGGGWGSGRVSDGTVRWRDIGLERDLYDMRRAKAMGWEIKVARAVVFAGSSDGIGDVYTHCKEMLAEARRGLSVDRNVVRG